ncbi:hypothetical protein RSAG8_03977, partial [Rhizoctonia solani AG-8 WAC10335]
MADLFTASYVTPVDTAVTAMKSQRMQHAEPSTLVMGSQSMCTLESTKAAGSNFSMCELIM